VFISFAAFTGSSAGIYLFVATQGCWLVAIVFFLGIILITVGITVAAARLTRSAADFFVADGRIGGVSNGFVIAGDSMSAATLLGISVIIFNAGYDAVIYLSAGMAAFSILIIPDDR
jgi:cation/acetate symporter